MLVRILLGLLLAGVLVTLRGSDTVWADPDQCAELVTDYSLNCMSGSTACGAYCFYPVCLDCEDTQHQDHGFHTHTSTVCGPDICTTTPECTTDALGVITCVEVTTCVPDCWQVSDTHQDHGSHSYEVSPCTNWEWHLLGEPDGHRFGRFNSPNLGSVPPPTVVSPTPCLDEDGLVHNMPVVTNPALGIVGGQVAEPPLQLVDLGPLKLIPGGDGAPVLDYVTFVGATPSRVVRLRVSGDVGAGIEYRYWPYSGFVPIEFVTPFVPLMGDLALGAPGLLSFQVRSFRTDPEDGMVIFSEGSNVVHLLVDAGNFGDLPFAPPGTIRPVSEIIPELTPGAPVLTPQPTLELGMRPAAPRIVSVVPDPVVAGRVTVTVSPGSPVEMNYRWWRHSGFGPPRPAGNNPPEDRREWVHVHPVAGQFVIDGLPVVVMMGMELPTLFDFQLMYLGADGVESRYSDVVVQEVPAGP